MYKAIHHDGYKSLVDVSEYLARHDIVYRRPALKPYEGLPVGDGKWEVCCITNRTASQYRSIIPTRSILHRMEICRRGAGKQRSAILLL